MSKKIVGAKTKAQKVLDGFAQSECLPIVQSISSMLIRLQTAFDLLGKSIMHTDQNSSPVIDPSTILEAIESMKLSEFSLDKDAVDNARKWAIFQLATTYSNLGELIRQHCAERAIKIDGGPRSFILANFLHIVIDFESNAVFIEDKKLERLSTSAILKLIDAEISNENKRSPSSSEFLLACYRAYSYLIKASAQEYGTPMRVRDVYKQIIIASQPEKFWKNPNRANLFEYDEHLFKRDLVRLFLENSSALPTGESIELLPTAFPKQGIPIPLPEGTRYIGHIAFRRA